MKIYWVRLRQEFDAPIGQVWGDLSDHANFGRIMGMNIVRIKDSPLPDDPNGRGSVRLIKAPILSFEETIRKSEKPTLIEYQISKGTPLHHHYGTMQFDSPAENKTVLSYTIELGSQIPFVGFLVKMALQNAIASALKKYARQLNG